MTHMDQETAIEATKFPRVQRKLVTNAGVTFVGIFLRVIPGAPAHKMLNPTKKILPPKHTAPG